MAMYPSVRSVESIEHNKNWMRRFECEPTYGIITYYFVPKLSEYAATPGKFKVYDLIFIDGRRRFKCLELAKEMLSDVGAVVLHDSERWWYDRAVNLFPYSRYTDDGSTVTMTNSEKVFDDISSPPV